MAFSYARSVTVDHTKVGTADVANYVTLFAGTYTYLKTVANGGLVQNSNGYDICFGAFTGAGGIALGDWDVEYYNATTGAIVAWVNWGTVGPGPNLSHSVDQAYYVFYGDPTISTFQGGGAGATSTWGNGSYYGLVSNYTDGTTLHVTDQSGSGNNGTNSGGTAGAGPTYTDGALALNGSSWVDYGTASAFDPATSGFSVECWVNSNNAARATIAEKFSYASAGATEHGWTIDELASGKVRFLVDLTDSISTTWSADSGGTLSAGWHHIVATWDPSGTGTPTIYLDGTATTGSRTGTGSPASISSTNPLRVGFRADQGNAPTFTTDWNGSIDGFRTLKGTVLSSSYVTAAYNNQSAPDKGIVGAGGFYTVGSEVSLGVSQFLSGPMWGNLAPSGSNVMGGGKVARYLAPDRTPDASGWLFAYSKDTLKPGQYFQQGLHPAYIVPDVRAPQLPPDFSPFFPAGPALANPALLLPVRSLHPSYVVERRQTPQPPPDFSALVPLFITLDPSLLNRVEGLWPGYLVERRQTPALPSDGSALFKAPGTGLPVGLTGVQGLHVRYLVVRIQDPQPALDWSARIPTPPVINVQAYLLIIPT